MDLTQSLLKHVREYHFSIGKTEFWAPYLRNDNYTEDPNVPRGLGKSSPEEIREAAEYIFSLFPDAAGEIIRQKLIDGSLPDPRYNYKAVECSGFVYHVMDRVYQDCLHEHRLMDDLTVPKTHVLNGAHHLKEWRSAHYLSDAEAESLPEDVPLRWVVETFKRQPERLCRVAGLVSDVSSAVIKPEAARPTDLVYMQIQGDPIPHVAIITDVNDEYMTIAHSGRLNPHDVGGVAIERLTRLGGVPDTTMMRAPHQFIAIRRLSGLLSVA